MVTRTQPIQTRKTRYFRLRVVRCFCICCAIPALTDPTCAGAPPLALGFKGDNAPLLLGTALGFIGSSPVTLLRRGVRPTVTGRPALSPPEPAGGPPAKSPALSPSEKSEYGVVSVPRACLLAFSCLAWTDRKCCRSSCHLISSLPIFDLVDRGPTDLLNAQKGHEDATR